MLQEIQGKEKRDVQGQDKQTIENTLGLTGNEDSQQKLELAPKRQRKWRQGRTRRIAPPSCPFVPASSVETRRQKEEAQVRGASVQLFGTRHVGVEVVYSHEDILFGFLVRIYIYFTLQEYTSVHTQLPQVNHNGRSQTHSARIPLQGPQIHLLHRFRWHHHNER